MVRTRSKKHTCRVENRCNWRRSCSNPTTGNSTIPRQVESAKFSVTHWLKVEGVSLSQTKRARLSLRVESVSRKRDFQRETHLHLACAEEHRVRYLVQEA